MQRVGVMVAVLACATAVSAENCNVDGVAGNCIHTSQCTGKGVTTSGLCQGPSEIKCCTYGACSVDAIDGDCILSSTCTGKSTAGKCPGPSGVQCCTPDYGTCTVSGVQGECIGANACTGKSTAGKCPGPSGVQCCTPDYGTCTVDGVQGECIGTSACTGTRTAGKCSGPSDVQCCTPDYGTCTVSGVQGKCIGTSACTGTRTAGKCSGPSDVQCCTSNAVPPPPPPPPPLVSSGKVPQAGLELIQKFEGLRLSAYPDPLTGNLPITIGYGATRKLDGSAWVLGDTITEATAVQLLEKQAQDEFLPPLEAIPVWEELNTNQRGAILSFAYNLGAHFYGKSGFTTISRVLREKQWDQIRAALVLYRNPGSSVEAGLRRRREAEADLFLKPL